MALYRSVQSSFWTDTKITDDFTPEDRYFYLYLFTNPHTNISGCYEISTRQMQSELGFNSEKVEKLIDRFSDVHKVVKYSKSTKELLLINWHKYNWNTSIKLRRAVEKEIEGIKCPEFKQYLSGIYNEEEIIPDISEYSEDIISKPVKEKKTKTVFVPPTAEEVKAYCQERKNNVDAETFVDFYASKGWKVGKDPMKDWKACVRTWEKNGNYRNGNERQGVATKNQFQQFEQREYSANDMAELERRKLGVKL